MKLELGSPKIEAAASLEHRWLQKLHVSFVPDPTSNLIEVATDGLAMSFMNLGHVVEEIPTDDTDLIITTAAFGKPVRWRNSLFFTARRRFGIKHFPTICTLVHVTPDEYRDAMDQFERALKKDTPNPEDFDYPGLTDRAFRTLYEQGRRGGPILSFERLVQAQSMCLRVILVIGDDTPELAYIFDLVGAYPEIDAAAGQKFYDDIALRLVTALSSGEVTNHEVIDNPISAEQWQSLKTPTAMRNASRELDSRGFFTDMVRINDLVEVPAVPEAVADQYSEGCFATWDPDMNVLIATVTGSARPVSKGDLTDDDLAVITSALPGGDGVYTRPVEGLLNTPPSSEAFEMIDMDDALPNVMIVKPDNDHKNEETVSVPVSRSKLHGHRGVIAYDPKVVAYTSLDQPFYLFPVTCGSAAQAGAIKNAFANCKALQDPEDPRMIAFTILPGHGLFIAEKWDPEKKPFQLIWEAMDKGQLEIVSRVPQGIVDYQLGADNLFHLVEPETRL